jgi:methyl-accepting chemotaxis protein
MENRYAAGAGYAVIVTLLCLVAWTAVSHIDTINTVTQRILDDRYVKVVLATSIQNEISQQATHVRDAMLALDDAQVRERALEKLAASVKQNEVLNDKLQSLITSAKGKQLFATMTEARVRYRGVRNQAIKLLREGQAQQAVDALRQHVSGPQQEYFEAARALVAFQESLMSDDGRLVTEEGRNAVSITIALAALAACIAVSLGFWLTRSIVHPLCRAVALAKTVAAGDLNSTVDIHSRDEVGELLLALKEMNDGLKTS